MMVDRISNLPDEILLQILSFLPTEDAYATRVLAKKWRPLWFSVPTFDFDDCRRIAHGKLLRSPNHFIQFVYAAMLGRSMRLKTLRLQCSWCPTLHLTTWLNAAAEFRVENLEINVFSKQTLPCSIFTIKTLVVLKLQNAPFGTFPSSSVVDLPSLKVLNLDTVRFLKPQHFVDLLNGCPNLENLEAERITFVEDHGPSYMGEITTSLSKLVRANVSKVMKNFNIPVGTFCNVEFLRLDRFCDVNIPTFANLTRMELILWSNVKWKWVLDMLNHCPQLQTLILDNLFCAGKVWPITHAVTECFSSQLKKCLLKDFTGTQCEMRFVKFVLQNSALLDEMRIFFGNFDVYYAYHFEVNYDRKRFEILRELNTYPRRSATCELFFM